MGQRSPLRRASDATRSLQVLQVEDNLINRQLVDKILTRAGHAVVNASNGLEALAVLENHTFDAIVMDRHMPGLNGLEATKRIRAMPQPVCAIPIVGLTAGATQTEVEDCYDVGMDVVMTKPLNGEELVTHLERLTSEAMRAGEKLPERPILVVDDESINRAVAMKQLSSLGYLCAEASDGENALAMAKETDFLTILLDVSMPIMDGISFTKLFREWEEQQTGVLRRPKTPVIAVTGHTSAVDRERFLAAGMDDVLIKPLVAEELGEMIARWRVVPHEK